MPVPRSSKLNEMLEYVESSKKFPADRRLPSNESGLRGQTMRISHSIDKANYDKSLRAEIITRFRARLHTCIGWSHAVCPDNTHRRCTRHVHGGSCRRSRYAPSPDGLQGPLMGEWVRYDSHWLIFCRPYRQI